MRIAQLAPLAESVPPKLYGGTERVVAWLVDELVDLGHEVTLFASGDSRRRGELHAVWPRALRLGRPRVDPNTACTLLIDAVSRRARDFDVVHAHIDWLHLPALSRCGIPFLTTLHGRLDLPGIGEVVRQFREACFVSISDNQRAPLEDANWCGTVHHAGRLVSAVLRSPIVPRLSSLPFQRLSLFRVPTGQFPQAKIGPPLQ